MMIVSDTTVWYVALESSITLLGHHITDLRLCSRILNVPNEKNSRCVILSNRNGHLINTIHPVYHITFPLCVYGNVLIFVPILSPSPQTLCLSHTISLLSLSLRELALFSSFSITHKTYCNLFWVFSELSLITIKSFDEHCCFTYKGLDTIRL